MEKSFLQSNQWLDFQKSLGRKIWQIEDAGIIRYNLPLKKSYLYSPRCEGKFFSESFLKEVKEIAKKENAIFFKIEPFDSLGANLKDYGFVKGHNIQPQKTLILDITKSEQELLGEMHSKTRYNIGLAEKKGIKTKKDKNSFEQFWKLMEQTTKRDGFHSHPKEYYKKLLEITSAELFVAEHKNKIIAANIVVFYNKQAPGTTTSSATGQAIYLHGASDYEQRNLMAAPLLQWEQIKEAKKRGCDEYDFWGIDEIKWPGVTRFKKGFGGKEIDYPGAYDLIFQTPWYNIYRIARKIL